MVSAKYVNVITQVRRNTSPAIREYASPHLGLGLESPVSTEELGNFRVFEWIVIHIQDLELLILGFGKTK